jgi:CubicO group peptidase (beta-lactamase class C family)
VVRVDGNCDARFGEVREALADSLDGDDVGASAAVYLDGEPVVDIWGGYADSSRTTPWGRETIVNVWSITKTMTALCALILADRGELDLVAPVAAYWPEFAAAGKEGVQVRHLLSHSAGLPTWDEPLAVEQLYDWETATARLAAQTPRWEPGTAVGYHTLTQGHLVGEVVRRVTGRSLGTFFAEEVAGPLGADFHIGLPPEHDHRVAEIIPPHAPATAPAGTAVPAQPSGTAVPVRPASPPGPRDQASAPPDGPGHPTVRPTEANTVAWRRAEIPAGGGHGNARSVAAVQSVLACGGAARGVRLLSEAGCELVFAHQFHGMDRLLGMPIRFGMGYALNGDEMPISPNPRTCFWGGWGGSLVVVDLDARMAVAYVMNRMLPLSSRGDYRALSVVAAAYAALGD